jgi:hypothetical protein
VEWESRKFDFKVDSLKARTDKFYFGEDLVDQKNPTINNLRFNDTIFFKQKIFKKWKISNHRYTRLKIQKGSLDFLEGARGCHLKNTTFCIFIYNFFSKIAK